MKNNNKEINKLELNEVISLSKKLLKVLYIVFIAILILVVLLFLQRLKVFKIVLEILKVISPFFIGFIVSWLLRPLVLKLNKKINNNTISSMIVFGIFIFILFIILYIFIPTVYEEVNELVGFLPSLLERLTKWVNELFIKFSNSGLNLDEFKNKLLVNITSYSTELAKELPTNIINLIINLFSGIGTFTMGLIIGIYMLIDYDDIGNHFKNMFPIHMQEDLIYLINRIGIEVRKCVNGTFFVALMVLIFDSLGFAIIGLNAPLLFGLICGLTDLIPFIGPYIGGAAAVIVGFTQSPIIGVCTIIVCVIVQLLENYVLQPVIMSKASSVHPIIIIIGLLVFGHFFGIIGMILATPTITIGRVILEYIAQKINNNELNY